MSIGQTSGELWIKFAGKINSNRTVYSVVVIDIGLANEAIPTIPIRNNYVLPDKTDIRRSFQSL